MATSGHGKGARAGLAPWYILWVTVAAWLLALPFSRVVQVVTLVWALVSVVITPPRPWPWFQRTVRWMGMARHFPITVDTTDFDAAVAAAPAAARDSPLMYIVFPHGLYSASVNFGWGTGRVWSATSLPCVPDGNFLIGSGFWALPLAREWYSWLGFGKCNKGTLQRKMRKRETLAMVPGGFEEAVLAQPGLERLWMGSRGGFVKLALQHGYRLVPVYGFGETDLGPQAQCCVRGRAKFAGKTRIPMTLPTDLRIRRRPITTVVGAPLQLPVIDKPSRDDVEQWRVRVVRAITELYNKHRGKHGRAGVDLQIMG